jgi:hypothetical protein
LITTAMLCITASMAYLKALACKAALVHTVPSCHASAPGAVSAHLLIKFCL